VILSTLVIDIILKNPSKVVVTSSQREPLSLWPRPFEVKQVAKIDEKEGKIGKNGYLVEF
jgi:hypothetical protein